MVKRWIIGVVIFLLISLIGLGFIPFLDTDITDEDTVIEVLSDYKDPGIKSCYGSLILGCKETKVEVSNNVDTTKIGDYVVTYKIEYKNKEKVLKRNVRVVDNTAPELEIPQEQVNACPKATDVNMEYKATDNYDGDITSKVIKTLDNDKLTLTVEDSSNNKTTKTLSVTYQDVDKPTISLEGNDTIYLSLGSAYKEPGFTALDNCSGDITSKVTTSNNINSNKVGTYEVNYQVVDDYNNEATIKRTVKVITNQPTVSKGNKIIYLTFDDGPGYYTNELLDILKEYNVKATFFVTWQHPGYANSIKRAYEEGHAIGLHTYSHVYANVYASIDAYFKDLEAINAEVKNLTGIDSKLIRFPGGSSNTVSRRTPNIMTYLAGEVQARGYQYFDWNVSSGDTSTNNSTTIANNVIKCLNGGTYVVLQHDTKQASVKAVRSIIEYGLANGYTFLPLDITSPAAHHHINN